MKRNNIFPRSLVAEDLQRYFISLKSLFILSIAVFFISALAGYIYTSMNPASAEVSLQELQSLVDIIKELSPLQIMLFIFLNNALKSLAVILLGVSIGVIPLLFLAYNGYALGAVAYVTGTEEGLSYVLLAITPHGLIELPMIFISVAIGVRIGLTTLAKLRGQTVSVKQEITAGMAVFIRFVAPLLLVASVIETFVTPMFIALI
ncbi:stage II sporulation protein M [Methanohalophilus sp. RSK]|uniref:stage II sporulation protein M n=1 Tax=Methanohalophilus sp. RSK TaxID=2485783 RepID=UPI000F43BF2C|nr:stage II sporulation protein M [Methanohalophilus sp. RSK]RNI14539.1 stage II sporulation protein M [Methanohalophilus sp. RSK]